MGVGDTQRINYTVSGRIILVEKTFFANEPLSINQHFDTNKNFVDGLGRDTCCLENGKS